MFNFDNIIPNLMYKLIFPAIFTLFCAQLLSAQCIRFSCPTQMDTICDLVYNNPQFWNEAYWLDPTISSHDLAEAPADIQFRVIDTCGGATLAYVLQLDLDNNGTLETYIFSDSVQQPGRVPYGNTTTPGGAWRVFDKRPVTDSLKYRFSLEQTSAGDTITGRLRWNTLQAGHVYSDALLPLGKHRIIWYIRTLTTVDSCVRNFRIRDCRKPDIVCAGGFTGVIAPSQILTVYAIDFLQSIDDNVTPGYGSQIAIIRTDQSTGIFPTNSDGTPKVMLVFACYDMGTRPLQLWAKDRAGNVSFCETYVIVTPANDTECGPAPYNLHVCAYTQSNANIQNVDIEMVGTGTGIPPFTSFGSIMNSCFDWSASPFYGNFTITLDKDDNHINGVSTFDLVLLSKHILGIAPFTSPYQLIAADVNKSSTITSFDIVELRKLILGIYTKLPNNTAWRFIDKDFVFPNSDNPWQSVFPETKQLMELVSTINVKFVGVKVGDLNGNALTMLKTDAPVEVRNTAVLTLPDLSLRAGETTEIPLQTSEAAQWLGFQASLQFDPQNVDIEIVDATALPDFDASSWAKPQPGRLNISWFNAQPQTLVPGENILTLRVHARTDVRLCDALTLNNTLLRAEAYSDQEVAQNLSLQFREQPTLTENTAIFPAQPNPTTAGAMIPLRLQSAEKVILEVFDATGKRVFQQANSLADGSQMIEIPAVALQTSGVYTWRVQAGGVVQAGKLVRR